MSTEENLILWTEVFNGVPGKRGVKCLVSGWAVFPKTDSISREVQARLRWWKSDRLRV